LLLLKSINCALQHPVLLVVALGDHPTNLLLRVSGGRLGCAWPSRASSCVAPAAVQTPWRCCMLLPHVACRWAFGLCLAITCLLTLGTKESSRFNVIVTLAHVLLVVFIIIAGLVRSKPSNAQPFFPFEVRLHSLQTLWQGDDYALTYQDLGLFCWLESGLGCCFLGLCSMPLIYCLLQMLFCATDATRQLGTDDAPGAAAYRFTAVLPAAITAVLRCCRSVVW
jgi:hypothetical protein